MATFWAETAYLGDRWAESVRLKVSSTGMIEEVAEHARPVGDIIQGPVLPLMPNLHSHAFQRAMAGLAERASGKDNFWTWRQEMYKIAHVLTPDTYLPIARYCFMEMLEAGYGAVAEFHYLHGATPKAMANALSQAAEESGIRMVLVPVFYAHSDFGGRPPSEGQRKFCLSLDAYADLYESITGPKGLSFHSLRAATIDEIKTLLPLAGKDTPIHTHVCEQIKEVRDCESYSGLTPIGYLTSNVKIDSRWCFVHATHADSKELALIAESEAVVGLCPTTESNLGDGFFPMMRYLEFGGTWGIGTDSQITIDPAQELRALEYHQRLVQMRRAILINAKNNVASNLYHMALTGGTRALRQPIGKIAVGHFADFMALDAEDPLIASVDRDDILARAIFATRTFPVKDVFVGGKQIVVNGRHINREKTTKDFQRILKSLI